MADPSGLRMISKIFHRTLELDPHKQIQFSVRSRPNFGSMPCSSVEVSIDLILDLLTGSAIFEKELRNDKLSVRLQQKNKKKAEIKN